MNDVHQQRVLVDEIRAHARAIAVQVRKGRIAFFDPADTAVRDSVEHRLEQIAEAAGKLPKGFTEANPTIPWDDLRDLRKVFAHPYDEAVPKSVDHDRSWRFALESVPGIDRRLERPRFARAGGSVER